MRFWIITIITISLMLFVGIAGNNQSGNIFTGTAFANSQGLPEISANDDDLSEFWKHFNADNNDDEDEEAVEEEAEEEEESTDEEEESGDDESVDDELNFLEFLSSQASEDDNSEEEEEDADSTSDEEETNIEPPDDINFEAFMESDPENWHRVQGVKVPFFFIMNADTPGINDAFEPVVARMKALKWADQMTNGISFKYEIATGDLYLHENMVEIPEFVHMVDRIDYIGVARFQYEVAIPEDVIQSKTSGRRVVAIGEKRSKNLAVAFESARKEAFTKAVRSAFKKERLDKYPDKKYQTGKITGWEILNEGWKAETESFYLQLRVWIEFDV